MPFDDLASLIVALSDLKVVQSITKAINANLPKDGPLGTIRPSSAQLNPRPKLYYSQAREPRIEPRKVEHPLANRAPIADYYDRTHRDHPVPAGPLAAAERNLAYDGSCECSVRKSSEGPFEAPWKHLPPVQTPQTIIRVNLVRQKVDLINKGTLLDLFV